VIVVGSPDLVLGGPVPENSPVLARPTSTGESRPRLGDPSDGSSLEALARRSRGVLLVDTYETLAPLDAWFREVLLPELPAGHLIVLAGRDPPAPGWPTDAGWRDLLRAMPLSILAVLAVALTA
jgi:hypothetical protein